MFLPTNVNDKQHGYSSWFIPNRADCMPALLSRYSIDTIWNDQASLVLEDESGQLEGDSAVVPLISEILGPVPFIPHAVYTDCITNGPRGDDTSIWDLLQSISFETAQEAAYRRPDKPRSTV